VLTNTGRNIRDERNKMSAELYHNASISRVLRWTVKNARFFSVKLPKANGCKKQNLMNSYLTGWWGRSYGTRRYSVLQQRFMSLLEERNERKKKTKCLTDRYFVNDG